MSGKCPDGLRGWPHQRAAAQRPSLDRLEGELAPVPYAGRDDVDAAAAVLRRQVGSWTGPDWHGQVTWLEVSPGVVALRVETRNGYDIGADDDDQLIPALGAESQRPAAQGELWQDVETTTRGTITEWSAKSRARMVRRLGELDYSRWHEDGGDLALVTITLAGWWEVVAPSAAAWKELVRQLREQWCREVDQPWRGLWKSELQERGAPHGHLLMRVPAMVHRADCFACELAAWFEKEERRLTRRLERAQARHAAAFEAGQRRGLAVLGRTVNNRRNELGRHKRGSAVAACEFERFETWLSRTWADVCVGSLSERDAAAYRELGEYARHLSAGTQVKFSGMLFGDPRRTAIYFLKHATHAEDSKEYQHTVPQLWREDGAGRFWGYWGFERATVGVEVAWADFVRARRVLRHVAAARQASTTINRLRSAGERDELGVLTGLRTMRRRRGRGGFGASGGGWVIVNDGIALALDVGRALTLPQPQGSG